MNKTLPFRLTKGAVETIVRGLQALPETDPQAETIHFLIGLFDADLKDWDNR